MLSHLELMSIQTEVLFSHNQFRRMTSINEPESTVAPRLFLGHTKDGTIRRYRYDLPSVLINEIEKLFTDYPNHIDLAKIMSLLSREQPIHKIWIGPAFVSPNTLDNPMRAIQITEENKELLQHNFPNLFHQLKWRQPCFAIFENERIVSICCSARSTPIAAEASVETIVTFRGKGYGYIVVAAWAKAVQEENRIPLYSTSWDNFASQNVAKKLKLIHYGTDIHFL
ncbi:GNAT family N-acetyltransferase [Bacillus cereus]|uniref:GNAT family N-acetyltransferase n=1 Tax=Bacillus cereus TaxID=1396 RepID=UPI000BF75E1E|nr:GNAT family N-acetyltransferase [Bacillus cereus]PFA17671.1 GNAT family N-acetyltransferase [Bacillus cereus]PGZ16249.1 GNAT family N-acetyltransferase [Bacillus cereus]